MAIHSLDVCYSPDDGGYYGTLYEHPDQPTTEVCATRSEAFKALVRLYTEHKRRGEI